MTFDPTYELSAIRISGAFSVPPSVPAGVLLLGLVLPDARQENLGPADCIELANADVGWVVAGNEGVNVLGTIAVTKE